MLSVGNTRRAAVAAILTAFLACGGKVPPTLFYVLNLAAPEPAAEAHERSAVLLPVRAGRVVGQGRIVYRESREQVGFYEYHRWAEDPEETVGRALRSALLASGTFASVVSFDGRTKAEFLLRGELLRLEEIDYGGPVRAEAEISLELVDAATGRVEWSRAVSRAGEVTASAVPAVVTGMSAAVEQAIKQLVKELDERMRSSE